MLRRAPENEEKQPDRKFRNGLRCSDAIFDEQRHRNGAPRHEPTVDARIQAHVLQPRAV